VSAGFLWVDSLSEDRKNKGFGWRVQLVILQKFLIAMALTGPIGSASGAAQPMLKACTAEIQKYKCDAKSESYAYECLSKHEETRTKDLGFSRSCFKAYASFEKSSGKGDKVESHQVENPEHPR
jgi:hypothetical protein